VAVQPVRQADGLGVRRVMEQAVHQRAGAFVHARVDEHPRRLVHDEEVIVFKEDVERDGFRRGGERAHRGGRQILPSTAA
jgi:hypothetical protein